MLVLHAGYHFVFDFLCKGHSLSKKRQQKEKQTTPFVRATVSAKALAKGKTKTHSFESVAANGDRGKSGDVGLPGGGGQLL